MDTNQIVSLLVAERDRLNAAIALLSGGQKKRGRPRKSDMPDWVTSNKLTPSNGATPAPIKRGRKYSAAQRKAASLRMKARWAAKKKAAKKA